MYTSKLGKTEPQKYKITRSKIPPCVPFPQAPSRDSPRHRPRVYFGLRPLLKHVMMSMELYYRRYHFLTIHYLHVLGHTSGRRAQAHPYAVYQRHDVIRCPVLPKWALWALCLKMSKNAFKLKTSMMALFIQKYSNCIQTDSNWTVLPLAECIHLWNKWCTHRILQTETKWGAQRDKEFFGKDKSLSSFSKGFFKLFKLVEVTKFANRISNRTSDSTGRFAQLARLTMESIYMYIYIYIYRLPCQPPHGMGETPPPPLPFVVLVLLLLLRLANARSTTTTTKPKPPHTTGGRGRVLYVAPY